MALAALPALAYLWLVAPRLLAKVQAPSEDMVSELFDAELHVEPDSWLDGRPLREALAATGNKMRLIAIRRGGGTVLPLPSMKLRAGDRLVVQDTPANLKDFEGSLKAALHRASADTASEAQARKDGKEGKEVKDEPVPATAVVAQMIVSPRSPLVGRSVRQEQVGAALRRRRGRAARTTRRRAAGNARTWPTGASARATSCCCRASPTPSSNCSATASACCSTSASRCRARTRPGWRW